MFWILWVIFLKFCTERSQIQPEPLVVEANAKFQGLPDGANDFGALRGTNYYFSHFMVLHWIDWNLLRVAQS